MKSLRNTLGITFSVAVVIAVLVLAAAAFLRLDARPRTDDAYLQADLVHMAPDVSGRVTELRVADNQSVHAGDVLFVIDQEPYRLRVAQAGAEMRSLEAKLHVTADTVASQSSKAMAANTGIGSAEAQYALASGTLARLQPLLHPGFVTAEQVDQARTSVRTAQVSLLQAQQQAEEARRGVTSTKPEEEELQGARASLAMAERDLRLTVVRAPCDGVITGLDVAAGEYAAIGRPLFTIIDTEHCWVVGNFRETDLDRLRVGQPATVYVLSAPSQPLRGTVDSLGAGVDPDEGAVVGGLPRVPRSLNWVRIAQRFPVRILLDRPPPALMRVGATAVVVVDR